MGDSINYCANCETNQLCHTERKCMRQAHGSPAPPCCADKVQMGYYHGKRYAEQLRYEEGSRMWSAVIAAFASGYSYERNTKGQAQP